MAEFIPREHGLGDGYDPETPRPVRIAGVVLAAGSARRYGAAKQLVEVDGEALVVRAVRAAVAGGLSPLVVVVGEQAEAITALVGGMVGVTAVYQNPGHADGVSTSIAVGIGGLGVDGGDASYGAPVIEGIAFLTSDQPGLDAKLVAEVVAAFTPGCGMIVRPVGGGVAGHPVIFDARYVAELLALEGDVGGVVVMGRHVGAVVEVDVGEAGRVRDLDRPWGG